MSQVIRFYRVGDARGFLSNFAPSPIRLKGRVWPTVEHYFQAQKYAGTARKAAIRKASWPRLAARMGRDRTHRIRRDWGAVKVGVMRAALVAKFTQHQDLREALLSTGDAELVVHTDRDRFWGDGGDGSGKNMLGRLLMSVREQLLED